MPMSNEEEKQNPKVGEQLPPDNGFADDSELRLEGEGDFVREDGSAGPGATGDTLKMPGQSGDEKLLSQVNEWKSRAAYLAAEVENMRKRFARERIDVVKMANESLIRNLIPVLDNMQFGLKAIQDGDKSLRDNPLFANLYKGMEMVLKHFEQSLEQVGVKPIKSVGLQFDPAQHEALGQSNDADAPDNQVTGEMQRGFTLHERVLRPARVIVNKVQN